MKQIYKFVGLVNGAFGIIKDIIYINEKIQQQPDAIIIYIKQYNGPQFFTDENRHNWIPFSAKSQFDKTSKSTRLQYPLRLAYALTTHKTQGDTLEKGIVDLGKCEKNLGSTFVQLSRFKKLTDFLIKPFPFSRLQKIADSKCLAPRMNEEKRLNELFILTKNKFKELIPMNI